MPCRGRHAFKYISEKQFFKNKQNSVHKTPGDKLPVCSVPEARQHPDENNIEKPAFSGNTVPAKGDIYIVPEPESQRNMPSSPEFSDTFGNIGIIEVFRKMETENSSEADGYIRVAGKVKINLESKSGCVNPVKKDGFLIGCMENGTKLAESICYKYFFAQTAGESFHTLSSHFKAVFPFCKAGINVCITDNRSGYELRKKGCVGAKIDNIFLRFDFTQIDIGNVAEYLEGIETDAYG